MSTIHSRHFHVPSGRLYLHGSLPIGIAIDDDAVPGVLQSHAMMELRSGGVRYVANGLGA